MATTKDYIEYFRKYQSDLASLNEMNELLEGFKDGKFCEWLDEEWNQSDDTIDVAFRDRLYAQIEQKIHSTERSSATGMADPEDEMYADVKPDRARIVSFFSHRARAIVAVGVLLVSIGVCYWQFVGLSAMKMLTISSNDSIMELMLPDSTHVILQQHSTLTYPSAFDGDTRNVKLVGNAYFEVHHDGGQPFIVDARYICIRVTGTKFRVIDANSHTLGRVILTEGRVNVRPQSVKDTHEIRLLPHQAYTLMTNGCSTVETIDAASMGALERGYYRFHDEPLKSVFQHLEFFYGDSIRYDVAQGSNTVVSGVIFLTDNLNVVLSDLSEIAPISWKLKDNSYYVVTTEK